MGEVLSKREDDPSKFDVDLLALESSHYKVVGANFVGGDLCPVASKAVSVTSTIWQSASRATAANLSSIGKNFDRTVIIADDGRRNGFVEAYTLDPERPTVCERFDIVVKAAFNNNIPIEIEASPRPLRQPGLRALAARVAHLTRAMEQAIGAETMAQKALQSARAPVQKYESLTAARDAFQKQKQQQQSRAYAAGRPADTTDLDKNIVEVMATIEAIAEEAGAAVGAIPILQAKLESSQRKSETARIACGRAVAEWAQAQRIETKKKLSQALDVLAVPLAEMHALDAMMASGHLGHLSEADRYFRGLKAPFYGLSPLDVRPSWIVCGSAAELPGIEEARSALLNELHEAGAGE